MHDSSQINPSLVMVTEVQQLNRLLHKVRTHVLVCVLSSYNTLLGSPFSSVPNRNVPVRSGGFAASAPVRGSPLAPTPAPLAPARSSSFSSSQNAQNTSSWQSTLTANKFTPGATSSPSPTLTSSPGRPALGVYSNNSPQTSSRAVCVYICACVNELSYLHVKLFI